MKIQENYNLSKLNTFGISANAKFFVEVHSEDDLKELFYTPVFKDNRKLFLGGGSNVLFTKDFDGLVVLNKLKGVEILKEDSQNVFIKCMSGEMWHDFVLFAVDRNLWGIENLALIPGTVGAAPVQNIGAYGSELIDVLESVEIYDFGSEKDVKKKSLTKEECKLGYRDSIFKNELKDKVFILSVTFKLSKTGSKNVSYKILQEYLDKNKIEVKNSKNISEAVGAIRTEKLPNPKITGNAGSFFKNVFVERGKIKKLLSEFPKMPYFMEDDSVIKIPSGWLIEQSGWKGKRIGNVGVHDQQALVLVNYGGATGQEILDLASKIILDVKEKFGLELTPEVNLI